MNRKFLALGGAAAVAAVVSQRVKPMACPYSQCTNGRFRCRTASSGRRLPSDALPVVAMTASSEKEAYIRECMSVYALA